MEAEEAQRRHELEMKHLELEQTKHWPRAQANNYEDRAKAPNYLPSWTEKIIWMLISSDSRDLQ